METIIEKHQGAKFAFYYMLSLVALIISAVSVDTVFFQLINKYVPDILTKFQPYYNDEALKVAISALIIAAPIFYLTVWQIQKNLFTGALDKEAGVRKWLTYFILFIAAVVMIVTLIITVNNFLNGELTMKFILKALSAMLISAAIFIFYFTDIRRPQIAGQKSNFVRMYFYISLAVILAAFIAAILNVQSPTLARNIRLDNAVLSDFDSIDNALNQYYANNKKLPGTLDQLVKEVNFLGENNLVDKTTGKQYDYKVATGTQYELCANFFNSSKDDSNSQYYFSNRWPHEAGYRCLTQKVNYVDMVKPLPAM